MQTCQYSGQGDVINKIMLDSVDHTVFARRRMDPHWEMLFYNRKKNTFPFYFLENWTHKLAYSILNIPYHTFWFRVYKENWFSFLFTCCQITHFLVLAAKVFDTNFVVSAVAQIPGNLVQTSVLTLQLKLQFSLHLAFQPTVLNYSRCWKSLR